MPRGTFRQWAFRGYLDDLNEGLSETEQLAFDRKTLSYRNVLTVAVAACLARSNIGVLEALAAAKLWAVEGSRELNSAALYNEPCKTLLVYHFRRHAKVIELDPTRRNPKIYEDLFAPAAPIPMAPVVADVNSVVEYAARVCAEYKT